MNRRSALIVLACWSAIGAMRTSTANEPNETFDTATVLAPGVLLASGELSQGPDTLLGTRNAILGTIELTDDDGSPFGNGFASGLQGVPTNSGQIRFAVTGYADWGFDGSHDQTGRYEVFVQPYDFFGDPVDEFSEIREMQPGVVDEYVFFNANWIGGTYDVFIDNIIDFEGFADVDYYRFTGLTAGASFTAETLDPSGSGVDTRLGWFSESGSLLLQDDDSGAGVLSLLSGVVPASGEVTLAVTGGNDFAFTGDHQSSGAYELKLTLSGGGYEADFNNDGKVDGADLAAWREAFGATPNADADGDNDSDGADFLVWQRQFGSGVGSAPFAAAVPEPSSAIALIIGLTGASSWRRLRQPPARR